MQMQRFKSINKTLLTAIQVRGQPVAIVKLTCRACMIAIQRMHTYC